MDNRSSYGAACRNRELAQSPPCRAGTGFPTVETTKKTRALKTMRRHEAKAIGNVFRRVVLELGLLYHDAEMLTVSSH
jgi:hypothetical protein